MCCAGSSGVPCGMAGCSACVRFLLENGRRLAAQMGSAYPELPAKRDFIERALKAEEERFGKLSSRA